jgi:CyaY protein
MTEAEFETLYRATIDKIEEALDEVDGELDCESGNDILSITCPNRSAIIITRQTPLRQLWMAAKGGGFHFNRELDENAWVCTINGRRLESMLSEALQEQAGVSLDFSL